MYARNMHDEAAMQGQVAQDRYDFHEGDHHRKPTVPALATVVARSVELFAASQETTH